MLLTGTHYRSLDEKGRVALPKPLREGLDTGENSTLYLAPGTDGTLALYPESTFQRLGERLQAATPNTRTVREYARLFFARAAAVRLDKQGRLRVPSELAEFAKLSCEVALVGVQDHVEIWPRGAWEQYIEQRANQYDELADSAFLSSQQET